MIPEPVLQAFGVGETLPVRLPGGHDLACRAAHPQTDRRRILFAAYHEPAVLDFSPYWRTAGFAAAVLVADAAVWEGANPETLFSMASPVEQLVVRAELRRLLELDGHAGVAGRAGVTSKRLNSTPPSSTFWRDGSHVKLPVDNDICRLSGINFLLR